MNEEGIQTALQDATDTEIVRIEPGLLASAGDVFRDNFGDRKAIIVADENTFEVAGEAVRRSLEDAGCELVEP